MATQQDAPALLAASIRWGPSPNPPHGPCCFSASLASASWYIAGSKGRLSPPRDLAFLIQRREAAFGRLSFCGHVHFAMTAFGPSLTCRGCTISSAVGRKADIPARGPPFQSRTYLQLKTKLFFQRSLTRRRARWARTKSGNTPRFMSRNRLYV